MRDLDTIDSELRLLAAVPRRLVITFVPTTSSGFAKRRQGNHSPMGERDVAQAHQLIRALCEVRDKTIRQLSWLGEQRSQLEAAGLREDINEAQALVTRLQRRYLGADGSVPQRAQQVQVTLWGQTGRSGNGSFDGDRAGARVRR